MTGSCHVGWFFMRGHHRSSNRRVHKAATAASTAFVKRMTSTAMYVFRYRRSATYMLCLDSIIWTYCAFRWRWNAAACEVAVDAS